MNFTWASYPFTVRQKMYGSVIQVNLALTLVRILSHSGCFDEEIQECDL